MAEPVPVEPMHPEHVKLSAVSDKSQLIGEFLEWLSSGQEDAPITLCTLVDLKDSEDFDAYPQEQYMRHRESMQAILARYFDIDLNVIEEEKRDMLRIMRERNAQQ